MVKTAAISYHSPHCHHAHQLFARLILALGRSQVFLADYNRGATYTNVPLQLATSFQRADIVVVLLSDQHFKAGTGCNLEWEEVVRRKSLGGEDTFDLTRVELSTLPIGLMVDDITQRPVRKITSDVLRKLNVGVPTTGATATIREEILNKHRINANQPDASCLVAAETLLRANEKVRRKVEVARCLRAVADAAEDASKQRVSAAASQSTYLVWQQLRELLQVFVDRGDPTDNRYFLESLPVVRLETYLQTHLPEQASEIFRFCDDVIAIAAMNRPGGSDAPAQRRASRAAEATLDDKLWCPAAMLARKLVRIDRLPDIAVGEQPYNFHDIIARYGDELVRTQNLVRTRLP